MKNLRVALFLFALALAAVLGAQVGLMPALLVLFVAMALLSLPTPRLCVTLTTTEILQDTLDAFKAMVPMLKAFSTDFSNARSRKGETIIAHISGLPSVQSYDNTSGFDLNHTDADSLLTDVPVVLDQLKHVPVRVKYLTQLASRKNLYQEAVRNYAYVLGKSIVDAALAKVVVANFTHKSVVAPANYTYETLENVRTSLNDQDAAQFGRFGIVNSAVATALQIDQRIASRDYYSQLNGGNAYRTFTNVAGFSNIWEYPDLPTAENLEAFYGDRRAIVVASRLPDVQDAASSLGIPSIAKFETITDPETGLSLLGISWQKAGTFDVITTIAALYGIAAGAQGGAADSITDKAGYWHKSAA
jgi:hypothetical protein